MRSTLSPMFTGSKMRLMHSLVATVGQQSVSSLKENIKTSGNNDFDFRELASKFTVDVIATTAYGIEVDSFKHPENEFFKITEQITNFGSPKLVMKLVGYLTVPSIMRALKITLFGKKVENFFEEAVHEMMKVREEKGIIRHDMLNLLIQAKKGSLSHDTKENEKITEGFATVEESHVGKTEVKRVWDDDDLVAQ